MKTTIEVKHLSKSYGSVQAVHELNLSVNQGEIFGLLGPNGAGKSTSVECILGTRKADCGSVSILGKNPRLDRKKLFEHVGVQFQEAAYPDKINVSELCEETASLYQHISDYVPLLQQFDLYDKADSPVHELSGGQKQRLFIVQALIPDPDVLFLDELTTGLDAKARRNVWTYLLSLKQKGITIFMTSHFMDEVEMLCDSIGILNKGVLGFSGSVKEAVAMSPYDSLEDAYLWYTDEKKEEE